MKRTLIAATVLGLICCGCGESRQMKEARERREALHQERLEESRKREAEWDKLKVEIQRAYDALLDEFEKPDIVSGIEQLKRATEELLLLEKSYAEKVDSNAGPEVQEQIAARYAETLKNAIKLTSSLNERTRPLWFALRRLAIESLRYNMSSYLQDKLGRVLKDANSCFDPIDEAQRIWQPTVHKFVTENFNRKLSSEQWRDAVNKMYRGLLEKRAQSHRAR